MTETSSLLTTYSLPSFPPVTNLSVSVSPLPNGNVSPPLPEEEEYTIKCICGYNDDDGLTVFCETCDTWQHIQCYYESDKVPDVHYCTDCAPKGTFSHVDADKARDRQSRARALIDSVGDRKVKRPASKGQKKKHRDTITNTEQPNGIANLERHDSLVNGKDQPPPAKKAKISHRTSGSIASMNGESRKRGLSNVHSYPSPSKSPQEIYRIPFIPQYTEEFLELYDRDEGNSLAKDNEQTVRGSGKISQFKNDPLLVAEENAQNDKTLFTRIDHEWAQHTLPAVNVETVLARDSYNNGKQPKWKIVKLQSDVQRGTIVGEIRGQIGTLEEYCDQRHASNRWNDLAHPDPFVFFHPHMDVYVDSRKSGTEFRYIRRSCVPNVTLRSYITPDGDVHHCFVAKIDISSGTELTASWYLPSHFVVSDPTADKEPLSVSERCEYISKVLANFGDCACGETKCRLEPFDRRSIGKGQDTSKSTNGRKRKSKPKPNLSPVGTGQATNSRAGSETIKLQDDEEDHRSTSGSSRNGVQSRDLTPAGGALLDEPPVLGAGLTQREIRKIQALEKQSRKGEKKVKKRPSGASTTNTSGANKHNSGSPPPFKVFKDISNRSTPVRPSKQVKPTYVSIAIQTDPEPCEKGPPFKRRKICTPTQRLLKTLLHQRTQYKMASAPNSPEADMKDINMKDAATSVTSSPIASKSSTISPVLESSPMEEQSSPLPSQAAHSQPVHGLFKTPAPRLNLSTLPPVPIFSTTTSGTPGSNDATTPIAQSPLTTPSLSIPGAGSVNPSPAKKKLSLGDYMSRRKESATPSTEKPSLILVDSKGSDTPADNMAKLKASDNEQAIEDTPMPDAKQEPDSAMSPEVQNVLSSLQQMSNSS